MSKNFILVLNCGSSSLKFSVINSIEFNTELKGIVEFISVHKMKVVWTINNIQHYKIISQLASHNNALHFVFLNILKKEVGIFNNIKLIGHRIVHGGSKITKSVIITEKIIQYITDACSFAPLHNPVNLLGIQASFDIFSDLKNKNIAVFDTSFHCTMPESSYFYAIPYKFYKKYGIRKYGAHGISYRYSTDRSSELLNISLNSLNLIICHLGNGASVSAIKNGICVDTSMGLTPLEGLVMGTRSGDIDPSIIFFMNKQLKLSIDEISDILINKSGLLGLSELSSDCRVLEDQYTTNFKVKIAIDMFCCRLAKYISAYTSLMDGRLDAIIFTGGIGENSVIVRKITVSKLSLLNIQLNLKRNLLMRFGKEGFINMKNTLPILVIPAHEELVIAKESLAVINKKY